MADPQGSVLQHTEDEPIEMLLKRECSFTSRKPDEPSDWLSRDRYDAVQWIRVMNDRFGFAPRTAYLAVSYLDRFLARTNERNTRTLRLSGVACFWLAAKVEETKPPTLSKFQDGNYNSDKAYRNYNSDKAYRNYNFDGHSIRMTELLVLSTLEWRMCSVTPFAYLGYFASKLQCGIGTDDLFSRATKLIFDFAEVMGVVDYRPSTVAFAAILAASDRTSTKEFVESKMGTIALPRSFETEQVFSCYALMIKKTEEEAESIGEGGETWRRRKNLEHWRFSKHNYGRMKARPIGDD